MELRSTQTTRRKKNKTKQNKNETSGPTENERYHWDTKLHVFLFLYGEPYSPIQQDSPFNPTRLQLASEVLESSIHIRRSLALQNYGWVCTVIFWKHRRLFDTMDKIGLAPGCFCHTSQDESALWRLCISSRQRTPYSGSRSLLTYAQFPKTVSRKTWKILITLVLVANWLYDQVKAPIGHFSSML